MKRTLAPLLMKRVKKLLSGCWSVSRSRSYTRISVFGRYHWAHRLFYTVFVEDIPRGKEIAHPHCRNRWCVNPAHLEPASHAQAMRVGLVARAAGSMTPISRWLFEQGLTSKEFAASIKVSTHLVKDWRAGSWPTRDREDAIRQQYHTFPVKPAAEGTTDD